MGELPRSSVGEARAGVLARRPLRPVWAEVDLGAVRHNARVMRQITSPAALCAVVKADGYGHGAVAVGRAALEGGATWLAVATVEEGWELREAGIDAHVLVLSEPPPDAMRELVAGGLTPTLYSPRGIEAAERAAASAERVLEVQIKVDTGMHRVGADPAQLEMVLSAVTAAPHLEHAALWTHLAVADGTSEEDREFTHRQLRCFSELRSLAAHCGAPSPMVHAANSAAAVCFPESRLDMVRCGIALYGALPSPELEDHLAAASAAAGLGAPAAAPGATNAPADVAGLGAPAAPDLGLLPVMSLRAEVCHVRRFEAGERPSYGRRYELGEPSVIATVPIGYADGVPRHYFTEGGTVLIGGRQRPLAGSVTMDQIMVDCGPDPGVSVGDEVVLIGEQGTQRLTARAWADVLGTISYEVLTGIGPRVPRVMLDSAGGAKDAT